MAAPIGPGTVVECILMGPLHPSGIRSGYKLGGVYVVLEVGNAWGHDWLNCVGMKCPRSLYGPDAPPGYALDAFRPIWGDASDLTRLLDVPAPQLEDA